jgi:hypothetical protein
MLVLKLRGVGMAETPLVVRFFRVGVAEMDGRRKSWAIRVVVGVVAISRSSSMPDMLPIDGVWPAGLLREDRGRRLSVVGLVE